jgi:GTP cyclohydrolase II
MEASPWIEKMASARVPIEHGEFTLTAYRNGDGKEHLAFVLGEIGDGLEVLTRLHSECLTGDVLGSLRCDCGPQLHRALEEIGRAGRGVLLYLRQEGRGIGLTEKLRAYNLQDQGYDTVDANLRLGFMADAREYSTAALMLKDLGVRSIVLMTNNPAKLDGLRALGVEILARKSIEIPSCDHNAAYLATKVKRMEHMLVLDKVVRSVAEGNEVGDELEQWLNEQPLPRDRPLVSLAYAQSLDGSIALEPGQPLMLSGPESQLLTHRLRRWHQGILVGVGTVVADDPLLTVRLVQGESPRPIVVDPRLRFPLQARLLDNQRRPLIATSCKDSSIHRLALQEKGAEVIEVGADCGELNLRDLLSHLRERGIERLMVEGGAKVLQTFLREQLADLAIVTIAPRWIGGLSATRTTSEAPLFPDLADPHWRTVGSDTVLWSTLKRSHQAA